MEANRAAAAAVAAATATALAPRAELEATSAKVAALQDELSAQRAKAAATQDELAALRAEHAALVSTHAETQKIKASLETRIAEAEGIQRDSRRAQALAVAAASGITDLPGDGSDDDLVMLEQATTFDELRKVHVDGIQTKGGGPAVGLYRALTPLAGGKR